MLQTPLLSVTLENTGSLFAVTSISRRVPSGGALGARAPPLLNKKGRQKKKRAAKKGKERKKKERKKEKERKKKR